MSVLHSLVAHLSSRKLYQEDIIIVISVLQRQRDQIQGLNWRRLAPNAVVITIVTHSNFHCHLGSCCNVKTLHYVGNILPWRISLTFLWCKCLMIANYLSYRAAILHLLHGPSFYEVLLKPGKRSNYVDLPHCFVLFLSTLLTGSATKYLDF